MPGEGILCQFKTGASALAETTFLSLLLKPKGMDFEHLSQLAEPCRLPGDQRDRKLSGNIAILFLTASER